MSATTPGAGPHRVTFGDKAIADSFREDYADHIARADDARARTVIFEAGTPEVVIDRAEAAALETRAEREGGFGQVPLTDREREQLDFSKGRANVPHARAVKAALTKQGVDDWIAHYDPTLTVDEHVADVAERGRGGGAMRERDPDDPDVIRERGRSAARAAGQECDHARGFCKMGDPEACEFLTEHCEVSEAELDAIRDGEGPEIEGRALGALKKAWGGYKGAIRQAEAAETKAEAEPHLAHARQAARAINAIRENHDQEPLEFERLAEVRGDVEALAGETVSPADPVAEPSDPLSPAAGAGIAIGVVLFLLALASGASPNTADELNVPAYLRADWPDGVD